MKVLRVLGLVFGILLLLAGGVFLGLSFVLAQSHSAIQQQVSDAGLVGPVDGTVVSMDGTLYTVTFATQHGEEYTTQAPGELRTSVEVGDTVPVYYRADNPSAAVVSDALDTTLQGLVGTARVAGIVMLVVGALLLAASVVGFVTAGKRKQALPAAQPHGTAGYPTPGQTGAGPAAGPANVPPAAQQPSYPPQQMPPYPGQSERYPAQQERYPTPPSPYPPQPPADDQR